MKTSLAELHAKLGPPGGRGYRVMYGADGDRSRYAFMTWMCFAVAREAGSIEAASGCGSACIAYNVVAYESEVYPDDNWTLDPCRMHEKTL